MCVIIRMLIFISFNIPFIQFFVFIIAPAAHIIGDQSSSSCNLDISICYRSYITIIQEFSE